MRIGIDARFLGPQGTGIGRYVDNLVLNLEKIDKDNSYTCFLRKQNWHLYNPVQENFSKVLADASWYSFKEQIVMPIMSSKAQLDLLHVPHFNIPVLYRGKMVVTIHDLIKSEFKAEAATTRSKWVYQIKHKVYEKVMELAVRRAVHVITPSNYVKNKIIDNFGIKRDKVSVTYEAADPKFFLWRDKPLNEGQVRQTLYKYNIVPPFIIYVGNAFPYKNLDNLLEALKYLPVSLKLVNPSVRNVFYGKLADRVHRLGLEHRVVLPGFVPDEELALLYKISTCFVFPSLSEGFGLPALEAMASGTAVVCSDIPVLKEVCADSVLYFNPYDPESIAKAVIRIIEDPKLKSNYIERGTKRAKDFSWTKTALQTLDIYRKSF